MNNCFHIAEKQTTSSFNQQLMLSVYFLPTQYGFCQAFHEIYNCLYWDHLCEILRIYHHLACCSHFHQKECWYYLHADYCPWFPCCYHNVLAIVRTRLHQTLVDLGNLNGSLEMNLYLIHVSNFFSFCWPWLAISHLLIILLLLLNKLGIYDMITHALKWYGI